MGSDRPITSSTHDLNVFILLKITASVYAPIYFAHALHVHAKYYLDDVQTIL